MMPSSRKTGHRSGKALFSQPVPGRASRAAREKDSDADGFSDGLALFLLHLARRVAGDELGVLLDFARAYSAMGLPNMALLVLHDALEADATCPACHFVLGSVFQDLHKPEEAIKAFKNAAELDPEHPLPWVAMGDTNMWSGDFTAALDCYDAAVAKPHLHGCAHVGRAHALHRLGRTGESTLAARRAREIATDCFITSYKLGLFHAVVEGNTDSAIECFRNCIRLEPDDDRAYSMLADIYMFREDHDKAAEYRAIAEKKHNAPSPKLSECWPRDKKRRQEQELGRGTELGREGKRQYDCDDDGSGGCRSSDSGVSAATTAVCPVPTA
ncbi:MAG: Tetratricopeptide repeat protein [Firmicutes bacterium ADurb.Bin506]|nr:MAG: Tetratricopeptide repeat protein [Firmicutes bacterium ADurb.Bin506]